MRAEPIRNWCADFTCRVVRRQPSLLSITRRHRKARSLSLSFSASSSILVLYVLQSIECPCFRLNFNSLSLSHQQGNKDKQTHSPWPQKSALHRPHQAHYLLFLQAQLTPTPAPQILSPNTTFLPHPRLDRPTPCSQNPTSKPAKPPTATSSPQQKPTASPSPPSPPPPQPSAPHSKHARA